MGRAALPSHALTDHRIQDQHLRVQSQTPVHATPPMSHGITQTGARTLQEIEAEMRLAAQQARQRQELESQQQLQRQRQHEIRLMEQEQQERHHLQQLQQQQLRPGQHQHQLQPTPPPRMVHHPHTQLPRTQSPRFHHQHQHQHQQQILLLQQEQERQQQERLKELQERLRTEEIERQLRAQQISQIQRQPSVQARRQASYADLQMLQQRRTHSPAYLGVDSGESPLVNQQNAQLLPQSIQLQQRLLSEMAQAEFMRDMQGISQIEQETLRAEAMRKIMETERMEEKRRRKALKIAHMVGTIHPYCSAPANYAITVTLQ